VHIYGPQLRYLPAPTSEFAVPDALPDACRRLHDTLGIERVVLVQPSGYGLDNSRQMDALAELGREARAIVSVPLDVSDHELRRLNELGARGARFAVGRAKGRSFDEILRFADRLAPLGWHVDIHVRRSPGTPVLAQDASTLRKFPVPLVIAHFADLQAKDGTGQADFQLLCDLVRAGNCWVKLSAPYRLSAAPPYRDLAPFAQALAGARSDRLLWASDWPHVNFKGRMPNTAQLLDCLLEWIPDESIRRRILVENPEVLYGFSKKQQERQTP
jgi:predicted TIM-barrel fold metal-dependent hydrolase